MPTDRLKISFSQIAYRSVFPVQIAATFASLPTARSIQSRCGRVIPANSEPTEAVRCLPVIGSCETAKYTSTSAGRTSAQRRGTVTNRAAAATHASPTTSETCSIGKSAECSDQTGSSAGVSDTALSEISWVYGSIAGSAPATSAASAAVRPGRGSAALDPDEQCDQQQRREVEGVPLLDPELPGRRERRDLEQQPERGRDRGGEVGLDAAVLRPGDDGEHDQRRERDDPDREVELRDLVPEPLHDLPELVAPLAGDRVGAEHTERRPAAHALHGEDPDGGDRDDRVHQPVLAEGAPAAPRRPGEEQRRGQDRRAERDRLGPRQVGEPDEREHDDRQPHGRPLEPDDDRQDRREEDRVEGVLGHQRGRVDHRGHRDRERGRHERERLREHAAGEEVGRDRGQRHRDRVDRLRRRVGVRDGLVGRPGGRDQQRVDEPVPGARMVADHEVAGGREALRELRVDQLVDHDPRRRRPAAELEADRGRDDHERRHPGPGRHRPDELERRRRRRGTASDLVLAKTHLPEARGDERRLVASQADLGAGPCDLAQHPLVHGRPAAEALSSAAAYASATRSSRCSRSTSSSGARAHRAPHVLVGERRQRGDERVLLVLVDRHLQRRRRRAARRTSRRR